MVRPAGLVAVDRPVRMSIEDESFPCLVEVRGRDRFRGGYGDLFAAGQLVRVLAKLAQNASPGGPRPGSVYAFLTAV